MRKNSLLVTLALLALLWGSVGNAQAGAETETVTLNINGTLPFYNDPTSGIIRVVRTGSSARTDDQWQLNLSIGGAPCVASGKGTEAWDKDGGTIVLSTREVWNCQIDLPFPISIRFSAKGDNLTLLGVPFKVNPPAQPPFAGPKTYWATDASPILPADFDVVQGHYFTQTGSNGRGFGVRDGGIAVQSTTVPISRGFLDRRGYRFWTAFQDWGGIDTLGYPISQVFELPDGFLYQAFQRGILQWRSTENQTWPANTLDWLHERGFDRWLEMDYGIPAPLNDNAGGDLQRATATRLSWLTNPDIEAKFLENPNPDVFESWGVMDSIRLYGLPASKPESRGAFIVQRFQRGGLQLWVESVPGMPAKGSVVSILSGDIAKRAGLLPPEAITPENP